MSLVEWFRWPRKIILFAALLWMPLLACAQTPAHKGAGEASLVSIHGLLDARTEQSPRTVMLRGAVTYIGREIIIQDQTGAIAVQPLARSSLALGDEVEVQGRFQMQGAVPVVRQARIRRLWEGSTPLPVVIAPDEAAEGAYNLSLVEIEGRLVKVASDAGQPVRLTLENGSQIFAGLLDNSAGLARSRAKLERLRPGSVLSFTGVLSVGQPQTTFDASTFTILLRSDKDVRMIAGPPWGTPAHFAVVFAAAMLLIWLVYLMHIRNMRLRFEAVVEERSRIARDIHDTLAQGFAGIALQLQAVQTGLKRETSATASQLDMALQMVRRSREEAHHSIAALRMLEIDEPLPHLLERVLRQLTAQAGLRLAIISQGTVRRLSDEAQSELLRIVQEAVTNAVQHARASRIDILLVYTPGLLVLEVADDGCGFQPMNDGAANMGHFGLAGIHERTARIGGTLKIESGARGTCVRVRMPLAQRAVYLERLSQKVSESAARRLYRFEGRRRINSSTE